MGPGFMPPWATDILLGLVTLLFGYLRSSDQKEVKDLKDALEKIQSKSEHNTQELMVFTAAMASHQQKVAYLEKQGDSIFAALRRIEDKLDGKQDKSTH